MLRFKQFSRQLFRYADLSEALNDSQKHVVDAWKSGAHKISGHVFSGDRISIPLEHPEEDHTPQPHPDVNAHLETHGYKIHDYSKGIAIDKHDRQVKIGKALEKTKADPKIKQAFTSDPARSGARATAQGLHVVISRHPHDVAGMSTGQGWTSCMNMKDGDNKHYLKHDVEQGTHVAYLAHSHDHNAEKPLARIALKPYVNKDHPTIIRPENRQYGTSDSAFDHTVNKWADHHFPMNDDATYSKHPKLYDDDGHTKIQSFNRMMKDSPATAFSVHKSKIIPEHISKALNHNDPYVRKIAIQHPKATTEHISKALSDENVDVRELAIQHPKATTEHISKALNDENPVVRSSAINHPKVTEEHISKALGDDISYVRDAAIRHPHATTEHISKALSDDEAYVRNTAINHPKVTEEHISKALNDKNPIVRKNVIRHPKATTEHISKALSDENVDVRSTAINHPKVTEEHISKALSDEHHNVRNIAIRHPKATTEHISKALNDENPVIRSSAIQHPKATTEHISKALSDKSPYVREAAIQHPKVTEEHINKALTDEHKPVRQYANDIRRLRA